MKKNKIGNVFLIVALFCLSATSLEAAADITKALETISNTIFSYVSTIGKVIFALVLLGIGYMAIKEPERLKEHSFKTGAIVMGLLVAIFAQDISNAIFSALGAK